MSDTVTRQGQTILIVEDNAMVRELIARILDHAGYDTIKTESPRQALQLCREAHPAVGLVLTDLHLPEMPGQALVAIMQRMQPDLRALYMSGDGQAPEGIASAEFLPKPFPADTLLSKVRNCLPAMAPSSLPVSCPPARLAG